MIQYKGTTLREAAEKGNLPLCVLIWGMAAAEKVNLMVPDEFGNNPLHYAVSADTPEVMGFIYQQSKGRLPSGQHAATDTSPARLVDTTNNDGETPFLKACYNGKVPILRALLDEGSDPFKANNVGATALIILAKTANLWSLHFVFTTMVAKFGLLRTLETLGKVDCDGHSCLDWASSCGNINIIEYLIRKGMNPQRVNQVGRGPLYWAVNNGFPDAVRFLSKAGCNPFVPDHRGTTPMSMARTRGDQALVEALNCYRGFANTVRTGTLQGQQVDLIMVDSGSNVVMNMPTVWDGSTDPSQLDFLYEHNRTSLAIHRRHPSRAWYTLLHGVLVYLLFMSSLLVPFWVWFGIVLLAVWIWRFRSPSSDVGGNVGGGGSGGVGGDQVTESPPRPFTPKELDANKILIAQEGLMAGGSISKSRAILKQQQQQRQQQTNPGEPTTTAAAMPFSLYALIDSRPMLRDILTSREKYPGFWLGLACTTATFLLCCVGAIDDSLGLMNFSSARRDSGLFWAQFLLFAVAFFLWLSLTFVHPDPGSVDTRMRDFDFVMTESLRAGGGPPPKAFYCHTMLMKKPTRSKYCASTGLLVARMDHYCVWLNNCVGFGNHRRFLAFIASHLLFSVCIFAFIARALVSTVQSKGLGAWETAELITDPRYFFVTVLASAQGLLLVFLCGLMIEQVRNIAANVTVNERINRSRYYWLHDSQGRDHNRFDRGAAANFFEFFGLCGYGTNYKDIYLFQGGGGVEGGAAGVTGAMGTGLSQTTNQNLAGHHNQTHPSGNSLSQGSSGRSAASTSSSSASSGKSKQTFIQQQVMQQQQQLFRGDRDRQTSMVKAHAAAAAAATATATARSSLAGSATPSISTASTAPSTNYTSSSSDDNNNNSNSNNAMGFEMHDIYHSQSSDQSDGGVGSGSGSEVSTRRPSILQQKQSQSRRNTAPSPTHQLSPMSPPSSSRDARDTPSPSPSPSPTSNPLHRTLSEESDLEAPSLSPPPPPPPPQESLATTPRRLTMERPRDQG